MSNKYVYASNEYTELHQMVHILHTSDKNMVIMGFRHIEVIWNVPEVFLVDSISGNEVKLV